MALAVSSVGSAMHADQVVDAQVAIDRFIEASHALDGHALAAGVRIDDQRVSAGDHADGVAGDRGQRMRDGRDRADDAERGVLDHRQPMVAAKDLAAEKLDARRLFAQRLELFDFVNEATDLGLVHFHRAELDALLDRDAAYVVDDSLAVFDGPLGELLEGFAGRGHGFVHVLEDAIAAAVAASDSSDGSAVRGPFHLGQHLLDNAADDFFSGLHVGRFLECANHGRSRAFVGGSCVIRRFSRGCKRSSVRRGPYRRCR